MARGDRVGGPALFSSMLSLSSLILNCSCMASVLRWLLKEGMYEVAVNVHAMCTERCLYSIYLGRSSGNGSFSPALSSCLWRSTSATPKRSETISMFSNEQRRDQIHVMGRRSCQTTCTRQI